jgi:hypothetical protein
MWIIALLACGTEYGFSEVAGPAEAPAAVPLKEVPVVTPVAEVGEPSIVWEVVPTERVTDGSSVQTRVVPGRPLREDSFRLGGDAPALTDVLFVVDNSISMRAVLDQVQDGFDALTEEGLFPPRTHIAVTSTTPLSPRNLEDPHPSVRLASVVRSDPGFAGLVDAARLDTFRALNGEGIQERMPLPGCSAWFEPTARVPGMPDVTCLAAHTQIAETPHGVEAGLVALNMLLTTGKVSFRPGASVNVVFVSDTHDPGVGPDDPGYEGLLALRPDAKRLGERLMNGGAAGFRIHAIAPATDCSEEPWTGTSYFDAAQATGGLSLDVCTSTPDDYVALAQRIAKEGARPQRPVVALSAQAHEVDEVLLDGARVGFTVAGSGKSVILDGGIPGTVQDVRIRYRTGARPARGTRPTSEAPRR